MGRPRADTPVPLTVGNSSSAIEHARLRCQPRGSADTSIPGTWVPEIITARFVYSISAPPPGDRVVRTRGYGPSALDSRHPVRGAQPIYEGSPNACPVDQRRSGARRRSTGDWLVVALRDESQHGLAVAVQLVRADTGDRDQRRRVRRALLGDRREGGVGEHDVGRHLLFLRGTPPPFLEPVEQLDVDVRRAVVTAAQLHRHRAEQRLAAYPAAG